MDRASHNTLSIALAILIYSYTKFPSEYDLPQLTVLIAFSILYGSYIPDLFHRGVKRNPFLHSIFGMLIITLTSTLLYTYVINFLYSGSAVSSPFLFYITILLSYFLHILSDMLTVQGVTALYPIRRRKFRIARLRYDHPIFRVFTAIILIVSILVYAKNINLLELTILSLNY